MQGDMFKEFKIFLNIILQIISSNTWEKISYQNHNLDYEYSCASPLSKFVQ